MKRLIKKEFLNKLEFLEFIESILMEKNTLLSHFAQDINNNQISKRVIDCKTTNIPNILFEKNEAEFYRMSFGKNIKDDFNFRKYITILFRINKSEETFSILECMVDYFLPNGFQKKFHSPHFKKGPVWHDYFHTTEIWTHENFDKNVRFDIYYNSETDFEKYYFDSAPGQYLKECREINYNVFNNFNNYLSDPTPARKIELDFRSYNEKIKHHETFPKDYFTKELMAEKYPESTFTTKSIKK